MVEVSHLTKWYGNHLAVSNLSFTVEKGQIYGFLGTNGAGKSSTMNMMTGCLAASSGDVRIGGFDIFEEADQAKKLIGYLPEQPPLYPDRTPLEYLRFVAEAKRVPKAEQKIQIANVMEKAGITGMSQRLIKNLSKGYKQRVGIAQALLGNPEVIILDEPTVGLDPKQIMEIRNLILELGKEHTVILSSHILSEVQAVCSTVLIISKGKLVACDTPDNLEKLFAGKTAVELTVEGEEHEIRQRLNLLSGCDGKLMPQENGRFGVSLETAKDPDDLCRELFFLFAGAEIPILRMIQSRRSLEDIFLELTSEEGGIKEEAE